MRDFSISIDIAAPPERVWAVMSDIERWHEWTSSVTSVTKLEKGPLTPGSRARIRQPKVAPAVWTITEVDPPHGFAWRTGSVIVWAVARHSIEAINSGSRVTLSLQFGGLLAGLVVWFTRDLNNRYLKLEADGLKRRSEAPSS